MYNELKEEAASHLQHSAALLQYSAYFPTLPFRKKMWNVHDLAASKRTNNDTEGWNVKWNRAVGKAGPGYYEAVLQLRLQQADTENLLRRLLPGSHHRRVVVNTFEGTNVLQGTSRDGTRFVNVM